MVKNGVEDQSKEEGEKQLVALFCSKEIKESFESGTKHSSMCAGTSQH